MDCFPQKTIKDAKTAVECLSSKSRVYRTSSGEGDMVWHEWGNISAPPLVLLHGGSGSWTHWIRNISELARYFRVLAPDTPGLGESSEPNEKISSENYPLGMGVLAEIVGKGIDKILGYGVPFHLTGFSMGSIFGAYLAAERGEQVLTFTLVGSSAFGLPWNGLKQPLYSVARNLSETAKVEIQCRNLQIIMTCGEATPFAGWLQTNNVERARLRSHLLPRTDTLMRALPKVKAPLIGIWGERDIYAQDDLTQIEKLMRSCDKDLIFEVIPNAGHWVIFDQPKVFNSVFLLALKARGHLGGLMGI
ncbi:MAG: hypothetical protein CBB68_03730 [Rhodospirillaceae bacterium TMED8]|nr:hypothetical protein [Magnetovibrio sp.]OUT51992.1 MAG: hypothetical protein CBB68_03730 [Rhodospirillaceae bacterium TMED8]